MRFKSPGSLVTTTCPDLRAQITTCAWAISEVLVRASRSPTAVASGALSGTTSVEDWRIRRERRACPAGLRIAWASAVAGIVIRMRSCVARASKAITRRSLRSSAISRQHRKRRRSCRPVLARSFRLAPFHFSSGLSGGPRIASAHSRSSGDRGPPVWLSASSSIARHPAASKRAT